MALQAEGIQRSDKKASGKGMDYARGILDIPLVGERCEDTAPAEPRERHDDKDRNALEPSGRQMEVGHLASCCSRGKQLDREPQPFAPRSFELLPPSCAERPQNLAK